MADTRKTELLLLYNRSIQLLNLMKRQQSDLRVPWPKQQSDLRVPELADQYNRLRSDVKKIVHNKRTFARQFPSVWCFKPLIHIPIGFLIIGLVSGTAYLSGGFSPAFQITIIGVLIIGFAAHWLGAASPLRQVYVRLSLLRDYLEDFIILNYPADAYKFRNGSDESLRAEVYTLRWRITELETELAAKSKSKDSSVEKGILEDDKEEELASLQEQLKIHYKNLQHMREEKAKGGFDVRLLNQIDEEQKAIQEIEAHIQELQKQL